MRFFTELVDEFLKTAADMQPRMTTPGQVKSEWKSRQRPIGGGVVSAPPATVSTPTPPVAGISASTADGQRSLQPPSPDVR